jgi:hypothetical protein
LSIKQALDVREHTNKCQEKSTCQQYDQLGTSTECIHFTIEMFGSKNVFGILKKKTVLLTSVTNLKELLHLSKSKMCTDKGIVLGSIALGDSQKMHFHSQKGVLVQDADSYFLLATYA